MTSRAECRRLWDAHLPDACEGWELVFTGRAARRFGLTEYGPKRITISLKVLTVATLEETLDMLRHEWAHAMTPRDHHGARWRATFIALGGSGTRLYSPDLGERVRDANPPKYRVICPSHGEVGTARRKSGVPSSCRACGGPRFNPSYVLRYVEVAGVAG